MDGLNGSDEHRAESQQLCWTAAEELREIPRSRSHQKIFSHSIRWDWDPKRTGNTLSGFIISRILLAPVNSWTLDALLRGDPGYYNPIKREWTLRTSLRWNEVFYLRRHVKSSLHPCHRLRVEVVQYILRELPYLQISCQSCFTVK